MANDDNSENLQLNRYIWVKPAADTIVLDPLKSTMLTDIPDNIGNIKISLNYALTTTGYKLGDYAKESFKNQQIATVHRHTKFLPVAKVLAMLAGPAYQLLIDPVNRIVDFKLKPSFTSWGKTSEI